MIRAAVAGAGVLLVVVALGIWLGVRGHATTVSPQLGPTTTGAARSVAPIGPIALTAAALKERAGALDQDVYWLGPEPSRRYELERTDRGDVFVRYLGAGGQEATTVGTYPLGSAYAATEAQASRDGWAQQHVEGLLVAYPTSSSATIVYVAAQGFLYQIEVYDPAPGRARALVESGAVTPLR
jgi:hypothetical protein